jgi:hypothetical protein
MIICASGLVVRRHYLVCLSPPGVYYYVIGLLILNLHIARRWAGSGWKRGFASLLAYIFFAPYLPTTYSRPSDWREEEDNWLVMDYLSRGILVMMAFSNEEGYFQYAGPASNLKPLSPSAHIQHRRFLFAPVGGLVGGLLHRLWCSVWFAGMRWLKKRFRPLPYNIYLE